MEAQPRREIALVFTASGSEYLRIWIVNVLLTVATLGFYLPFAKARRLRYFYANTLIDGQPLAFHGDPWKLLRGYIVMLLLFGGYAVSGHFSAWAAVAMFVLLALLWPALWRSSLRFRLHNSSWRGLRFGFEGSLAGAYQAILPLFLPAFIIVVANAWALSGIDQSDPTAMQRAMLAQGAWVALGFLVLVALAPLCLCMVKRYQHGGYRWAGQRAAFGAGAGAFYKLGLKSVGLTLLLVLLLALVLGVLTWAAAPMLRGAVGDSPQQRGAAAALSLFLGLGIGYLAVWLLGSYFSARLQDLSWNATTSQALAFQSRLRARSLAWLSLKNLLLTVITLGLYRPFAVVKVMALRLSALRVQVDGDIDSWQGSAALPESSASGEMAGDFFGIDLGL
jgi:uncharacterized membrane protein YjgN (DUF898 family)